MQRHLTAHSLWRHFSSSRPRQTFIFDSHLSINFHSAETTPSLTAVRFSGCVFLGDPGWPALGKLDSWIPLIFGKPLLCLCSLPDSSLGPSLASGFWLTQPSQIPFPWASPECLHPGSISCNLTYGDFSWETCGMWEMWTLESDQTGCSDACLLPRPCDLGHVG